MGGSIWALYESQPSVVLGFHGCDAALGGKILNGKNQSPRAFPP
jgi:hypothetical protein